MDTNTQTPTCPRCHVQVRATDFFCYNCGQDLKPKPPRTDVQTLAILFIKEILLPPLGLVWGLRYLRQKDTKSKLVGILSIVLTVVVIVVAIQLVLDAVNSFNQQLNSQLQNLSGF